MTIRVRVSIHRLRRPLEIRTRLEDYDYFSSVVCEAWKKVGCSAFCNMVAGAVALNQDDVELETELIWLWQMKYGERDE